VVFGGAEKFKEKLKTQPLSTVFPKYKGSSYEEALEYIKDKCKIPNVPYYPIVMDSDAIKANLYFKIITHHFLEQAISYDEL